MPEWESPSIAYSTGKKLSEVAADDQQEEVTLVQVTHGKWSSKKK